MSIGTQMFIRERLSRESEMNTKGRLERETDMKGKLRTKKRNRKAKGKLILTLSCIAIITFAVAAKGNKQEVVGYTYDSGSTVWEMAERNCPDGMDVRDVMMEIKKINGIEDGVVYKNKSYKIPVYDNASK